MKIFFLDTNIFIQCHELRQLPWSELCDDTEILLYIPRVVQEEIDHHKHDGNSRRAKRARKASSFLRQIILSDETKILIKESHPKVEISFTPPINNDIQPPNFLDLSRPDDRMITEILNYKSQFSEHDIAILTHDTNPLLSAKRCDLSYCVIPDSWLLPPEPNSKDKKINALEKQLKDLQNNSPSIEILPIDEHGNDLKRTLIEVTEYSQLSEKILHSLIENIKTVHPKQTDFSKQKASNSTELLGGLNISQSMLDYTRKYIPPSEIKIEKYLNEDYPSWIEKLKKYIRSLPQKFEITTRTYSLKINVFNNGTVPAENTIVTFEANNSIIFIPSTESDNEKEETEKNHFPVPPKAPEGRWVENSVFGAMGLASKAYLAPVSPSILDNLNHSFFKENHDRNSFYWKNGKLSSPSSRIIFECDEFRHQAEPESFDLTIFVTQKKTDFKGSIKCTVSAKNLPHPSTLT